MTLRLAPSATRAVCPADTAQPRPDLGFFLPQQEKFQARELGPCYTATDAYLTEIGFSVHLSARRRPFVCVLLATSLFSGGPQGR